LSGLKKNFLFARRGDPSNLRESEPTRVTVAVLPITDNRLGYAAALAEIGLALADPEPNAPNDPGDH
jgi:hypothetical protein